MGFLDNVGRGSVDEAAVKIKPILDEFQKTLIASIRESMNGIKITVNIEMPPVVIAEKVDQ